MQQSPAVTDVCDSELDAIAQQRHRGRGPRLTLVLGRKAYDVIDSER